MRDAAVQKVKEENREIRNQV